MKSIIIKPFGRNDLIKYNVDHPVDFEKIDENELKQNSYLVLRSFGDETKINCFKIFSEGQIVDPKSKIERPTNFKSESKQNYQNKIGQIISKLDEKSKVVLSRTIKFQYQWNEIKLKSFLFRLAKKYPTSNVYALDDGKTVWLGASPEALANWEDQSLFIESLAGTISTDIKTNQKWTSKEHLEQNLVTVHIKNKLNQLGIKYHLEKDTTKKFGQLEHLLNRFKITGWGKKEIRNLICHVHPTPAILGSNRSKSYQLIKDLEDYNRELYTGVIGIIEKGKPFLYINLRCMKIKDDITTIYAGGGITKASDPEIEWNETKAKANTLLSTFDAIK